MIPAIVAVSRPIVPVADDPVEESPYNITTSIPVEFPPDVGYLVTLEVLQVPLWHASDTAHKSLEPVSMTVG